MADLTTEFALYLTSLKTASPTAQDVTTLFAKDVSTVRGGAAASTQLDDANTMYLTYLTVDT